MSILNAALLASLNDESVSCYSSGMKFNLYLLLREKLVIFNASLLEENSIFMANEQ
jgi:hypothetical protein